MILIIENIQGSRKLFYSKKSFFQWMKVPLKDFLYFFLNIF